MPFGKIYLDSNIFISAHSERDDSSASPLLLEMLAAASERGTMTFATSELTLAEVLVRPMRHGDYASAQEFKSILVSSDWLDVQGVSRPVLLNSAQLRSEHQSLKLPDAIHIASAFASSCTHVLSADLRLRGRYSANSSTSVEVVRPTAETLAKIIEWLRE